MTGIPLADRETAVYRLYAADDTLLYVGCSWDPDKRIGSDHLFKPWGRDIYDVGLDWFENRLTALRAEAQAIADEKPLHNIKRPRPAAISAPKPSATAPVRTPGLGFEEAAEEVDIPVDWLWRGVALGKLPHSCLDPEGDEVWFTWDDIRDLHVIYNPSEPSRRKRQAARARVYRSARHKRCDHVTAF